MYTSYIFIPEFLTPEGLTDQELLIRWVHKYTPGYSASLEAVVLTLGNIYLQQATVMFN